MSSELQIKFCSLLSGGVLTVGIVGLFQMPTLAGSAFVRDSGNTIYACWDRGMQQAKECALLKCQADSAGCHVVATYGGGGYAAVAESSTQIQISASFASQQQARQNALRECARISPAGSVCRITLEFLDTMNFVPPQPNPPIQGNCPFNPATGLPIPNGICGGVDVQGNPYGVNLNQ